MSTLSDLLPEAEVVDGTLLSVKVKAGELHAALQEVGYFVPRNPAQSILSSVRMALMSGGKVSVSASDTTLSRTVVVSVEVLSKHADTHAQYACIPFLALSKMVATEAAYGMFSEITLTLRAKKNQVTCTLKVKGSTYEIPCVDATRAAKFPEVLPTNATMVPLKVTDVAELVSGLTSVVSATSKDDFRPGLQQVLLKHDPTLDSLVAVACDGHRYEQVMLDIGEDLTKVLDKVTLPTRLVKELGRIVETDVKINLGIALNSFVLFLHAVSENPETGEETQTSLGMMAAQRLAAPFPDLTDVLLKPTFSYDYDFGVEVGGKDGLTSALRRTLSNPDDSGTCTLTLNPAHGEGNGTLTVEGSGGIGASSVTVDVPLFKPWTSPARSVSFNTQALAAALRDVGRVPGVVTFRLGKELKTKPSALLIEVRPDVPGEPSFGVPDPGPLMQVVVSQSKTF